MTNHKANSWISQPVHVMPKLATSNRWGLVGHQVAQ